MDLKDERFRLAPARFDKKLNVILRVGLKWKTFIEETLGDDPNLGKLNIVLKSSWFLNMISVLKLIYYV